MKIEYIILGASWIVIVIGLILFIPRNKIRHAWVAFLFKQIITWLLGHIVAEYKLIEYPVRLFKHATKTSFSFEYFIYPSLCVFFNLYYPVNKSLFKQFSHYFIYCSAITILEVALEKYTDLISYIHWTWYWTWLSLFITFYLSRKFYLWFLKKPIQNF